MHPGSYVIYDYRARKRIGLVITYATFFGGAEECHEAVVIEDGRVTTWLLWETDRGRKWHVCSE